MNRTTRSWNALICTGLLLATAGCSASSGKFMRNIYRRATLDDGTPAVRFESDFRVRNLGTEQIVYEVTLLDQEGRPLRSTNAKYQNRAGHVATGKTLLASGGNADYEAVVVNLPVSEVEVAREENRPFTVRYSLYDIEDRLLAQSDVPIRSRSGTLRTASEDADSQPTAKAAPAPSAEPSPAPAPTPTPVASTAKPAPAMTSGDWSRQAGASPSSPTTPMSAAAPAPAKTSETRATQSWSRTETTSLALGRNTGGTSTMQPATLQPAPAVSHTTPAASPTPPQATPPSAAQPVPSPAPVARATPGTMTSMQPVRSTTSPPPAPARTAMASPPPASPSPAAPAPGPAFSATTPKSTAVPVRPADTSAARVNSPPPPVSGTIRPSTGALQTGTIGQTGVPLKPSPILHADPPATTTGGTSLAAHTTPQTNGTVSKPVATAPPGGDVEQQPTPARRYYTVQKGDTLGHISQRMLGTAKRWREIYELNRDQLRSPDRLPIGIELAIPAQ